MTIRPILFAAVFALGAGTLGVTSALAGQARAVIELFTSQGCSSCPPADRLLGQLAQDPSLITLSVPVDYWDYLGWKDTLALPVDSTRQRDYAVARGDREVYTPQVVINGMVHALGSNKDAIEDAIVKTRRESDPLSLPVSVKVAKGVITVGVPAATGKHASGEVWLCPVTAKARVSIGRGENRGRTITYVNVVRRWVKLGAWNGEAKDFTLPVSKLAGTGYALDDVDRLAVVVQSGSPRAPGLMLGAAMASLR